MRQRESRKYGYIFFGGDTCSAPECLRCCRVTPGLSPVLPSSPQQGAHPGDQPFPATPRCFPIAVGLTLTEDRLGFTPGAVGWTCGNSCPDVGAGTAAGQQGTWRSPFFSPTTGSSLCFPTGFVWALLLSTSPSPQPGEAAPKYLVMIIFVPQNLSPRKVLTGVEVPSQAVTRGPHGPFHKSAELCSKKYRFVVVSPFSLPLGEISDAEMLRAIRANLFMAVFFFFFPPISFRALMPFGFNGAAPSLLFSPGCIYRRRAHPH